MIAEIIAGATTMSLTGTLIWLVHGRIRAADAVADARVAQSDTEAHLERAQFELETTKQALRAANARAEALEGVLADVQKANPGAGLDAHDWHGRMLRLAEAWRGTAAESGVPAVSDRDDLSPPAAASSPNAHPVPSGSATVR